MRWTLIMSLSLLSSLALATEVYRSIDSQGNVKYSDRPDSASAVAVVIRTAAAAPATRQPVARPAQESSTAAPDEETIARAVAEQSTEDRAANCEAARTRSEKYDVSHRLYRAGANGEREYLTDAQIDEARQAARAEIARWCD